MPGADAWQAFGGVVAVLVFLSTGALALRRLGLLGAKSAPAAKDEGGVRRIEGLESELAAQRERVTAIEKQVAGIEATLKALPTAREFSEVGRGVTTVQGDVKAVKASIDGMDAMIKGLAKQVGTLNSHLLGTK